MNSSHVLLRPQKSRLTFRPIVTRTLLITAVLAAGFSGGLLVARNLDARSVSADTPEPAIVESQVVVVATQPDGSLGCSNLTTKETGASKGMVMYHSNGGRLESIQCVPAGGFLGLGSMP
jgi:hypothetical protein